MRGRPVAGSTSDRTRRNVPQKRPGPYMPVRTSEVNGWRGSSATANTPPSGRFGARAAPAALLRAAASAIGSAASWARVIAARIDGLVRRRALTSALPLPDATTALPVATAALVSAVANVTLIDAVAKAGARQRTRGARPLARTLPQYSTGPANRSASGTLTRTACTGPSVRPAPSASAAARR